MSATELAVSVRLKADGSGLVGQVRASREEVDALTASLTTAAESARGISVATTGVGAGARTAAEGAATASAAIDGMAEAADRAATSTQAVGAGAAASDRQIAGLTAQVQAMAAELGQGVRDEATSLFDSLGTVGTGWPRGNHAWWRLLIAGSSAGYIAFVSELAFRAIPGGPSVIGGGEPISSGSAPAEPGATYGPANAFDNDANSRWGSSGNSGGAWIGYQFASPVSINEISLSVPASGQAAGGPSGGTIQWSDDGETWTDAWSFANLPAWPQDGTARMFADPLYGEYGKSVVLGAPGTSDLFVREGTGYAKLPTGQQGSGTKSANTLALIAAIATGGSFPAFPPAAVNQPAVVVGAPNAETAISGSALLRAGGAGKLLAPFSQRFGVPSGMAAAGSYGDDQMRAKGSYRGDVNHDVRDWATGHSAFEFTHTGTDLELFILAAGGGGGLRLLVNDRIAWTGMIDTDSSTHLVRVTFPSAGTRRISWETANMIFLGVRLGAGNSLSAAPVRPYISWTGDSFIDGAGGYAYANNTPGAIAARALGCAQNNVAVGGTGLLNGGAQNVPYTHPQRILDLTMAGSGYAPAIGVISGSNNDGYMATPATLQAAIAGACEVLIDAWLAANPGKPLVLIGPWDVSGQAAAPLPLTTYYIRDGMQQAAYQYRASGVHFLDQLVPDMMVGLPTDANSQSHYYTFSDTVHPSSAGSEMRGLWHAAQLERLITTAFA